MQLPMEKMLKVRKKALTAEPAASAPSSSWDLKASTRSSASSAKRVTASRWISRISSRPRISKTTPVVSSSPNAATRSSVSSSLRRPASRVSSFSFVSAMAVSSRSLERAAMKASPPRRAFSRSAV